LSFDHAERAAHSIDLGQAIKPFPAFGACSQILRYLLPRFAPLGMLSFQRRA